MTCVQPATGMRVYEAAQKQIEQLVGKINGQYAKFDWTPIQLFTQPLPLEDLFCYYRVADICWSCY
jgi:glucosylglycerol-phosphate synthase